MLSAEKEFAGYQELIYTNGLKVFDFKDDLKVLKKGNKILLFVL
ncbi:hypothetical protein [Clostridium sp. SHJSY1]|nr:hypothetical protein [Clostridium sp. SHJSY1]